MTTQVYIVEDHSLMRQVMREAIEKMAGLAVCGVAASAEEALEDLRDLPADVALIDMSLPQMSGIDLVRLLRLSRPALRCLIFSGHKEPGYVRHVLAAGAQGYLLKGNPAEIRQAIATVMAGKQFISAALQDPDP